MSRWFRFYDEALDDPKVQRLAPHLFKTWINLLCLASKEDGTMPSNDDIAFRLRISVQDAAQQIDDLTLAGLIDIRPDGKREPHGWSARQYASDSSAERTRKYRKRLKEKPRDVTCDVTVTLQKQNRTDSEKESAVQSRACAPAAPPLPDRFMDRMIEAAGGCLANLAKCQGLLTEATPMMWLTQGCDFELDVLPTLRAASIKHKGRGIASWGYFNGMVAETKAKRLAGLPTVEVKKPKSSVYTPVPRPNEMTDADRTRIAMEYM